MSDWFASGRAIDLVLLVLVIEAALIARFAGARRWSLLVGLVPGAFLLLALRAALAQAPWQLVALLVTSSLPAHLLDLRRRLG